MNTLTNINATVKAINERNKNIRLEGMRRSGKNRGNFNAAVAPPPGRSYSDPRNYIRDNNNMTPPKANKATAKREHPQLMRSSTMVPVSLSRKNSRSNSRSKSTHKSKKMRTPLSSKNTLRRSSSKTIKSSTSTRSKTPSTKRKSPK